MANLSRSKPTLTEADSLARDIESLTRECEKVVQAVMDKDGVALSAATLPKDEFFLRAIYVCNADGSVSEEEAFLFSEIFAYLKPELVDFGYAA